MAGPVSGVHEQPEGRVVARQPGGTTYNDTRANFEADFGVQLPALPEGANERIYIPGSRHTLQGDGNVIGGGPMPWPLGDQIIQGVDEALVLKNARDNPPPTQEQIDAEAARIAKQERMAGFDALPEVQQFENVLATFTPAQMDSWLTTNITNITQARVLFGTMMKYFSSKGFY